MHSDRMSRMRSLPEGGSLYPNLLRDDPNERLASAASPYEDAASFVDTRSAMPRTTD